MSQQLSWDGTGLEARLLRALAKRGFTAPTPVQHAAVPRCLEGKDVLARARTGSGKTLAYLLPAVHCLLTGSQSGQLPVEGSAAVSPGSFQVLVLVPTRELCEQVKQEAAAIVQHCGTDIKVTALLGETSTQLQRSVASAGHLVVATPGKVASAVREGFLPPGTLAGRLRFMVLDEADLLLSYGYEEDLQLLAPLVPRSCQCILMSATSSGDVERLQKLVLHNPLVLNLLQAGVTQAAADAQGAPGLAAGLGVAAEVTHYAIQCPKGDRLLHLMALLKLGLVRKKVLIFVNTVDEGFRVKLFLESFGIPSALLNAELPLNSRSHILQTFNKGLFDYLIATDDVHAATHDGGQGKAAKGKKGAPAGARCSQRPRKDEEFGVTRGIDFKGVRTIINHDMPSSLQGYVHRVGRTGRAGESGVALSLFTPADMELQEEVGRALAGPLSETSDRGEPVSDVAGFSGRPDMSSDDDEPGGHPSAQQNEALRPFTRLSRAQVEALRYRGEDIARSITRHVIQEARARELKAELLNSAKLKEYFEDHSAEQKLLRHDKPLHRQPQSSHLRHIPAYLKDPAMIGTAASGVANFKPSLQPRDRKRKRISSGDGVAAGSSGADPLKAVGAVEAAKANTTSSGVKGFVRAPRRGEGDEELTEMEKRAVHKGKKQAKARLKAAGGPAPAAVFKQNVKKRGGIVRRR